MKKSIRIVLREAGLSLLVVGVIFALISCGMEAPTQNIQPQGAGPTALAKNAPGQSQTSVSIKRGRIVVLADDWTLGNYWNQGDTYQFTSNVFEWLTEDASQNEPEKILIDRDYGYDAPGHHNITGLLNALTSLGYAYTLLSPQYWTPELLAEYDAVLLERGRFSGSYESTIIRSYILDGGGILVIGGAMPQNIIEQNLFLNSFGINVNLHVNIGTKILTAFVDHPVTAGVNSLWTLNPTPITLVPGELGQEPQILVYQYGYNWLAVWDILLVTIDVKPGSDTNPINNNGHGVIPVAILSSADFDATQVDPTTVSLDGQNVRIAGKGNTQAHIKDVNGDGYDDLMMQIEDIDGTYEDDATTAILTGETFDGIKIRGTDNIRIVP